VGTGPSVAWDEGTGKHTTAKTKKVKQQKSVFFISFELTAFYHGYKQNPLPCTHGTGVRSDENISPHAALLLSTKESPT
jgi:hypothetical protein